MPTLLRARSALSILVVALFVGAALLFTGPAAHAAPARKASSTTTTLVAKLPKPKTYKNCTALHKDFPHGVGRKGARDHVRGKTKPVTNFKVYTAMYNKNKKSDADKDGVACEKH